MKYKIIAWIKAYIYNRWFGGKEAKAEAKIRRAEDKEDATNVKRITAERNHAKAVKDLDKTIDEIQSEEDY